MSCGKVYGQRVLFLVTAHCHALKSCDCGPAFCQNEARSSDTLLEPTLKLRDEGWVSPPQVEAHVHFLDTQRLIRPCLFKSWKPFCPKPSTVVITLDTATPARCLFFSVPTRLLSGLRYYSLIKIHMETNKKGGFRNKTTTSTRQTSLI